METRLYEEQICAAIERNVYGEVIFLTAVCAHVFARQKKDWKSLKIAQRRPRAFGVGVRPEFIPKILGLIYANLTDANLIRVHKERCSNSIGIPEFRKIG